MLSLALARAGVLVSSNGLSRRMCRGASEIDLITWYVGLPTSSSHALVGGYAGAAIAKAGWASLIASGWTKTLVFIVLAPVIGMGLGFLLSVACLWIFGTSVRSASTSGSAGCS